MATTVALNEQTLDLLKYMKKEMNTGTYDETINKMIAKIKRPKKSYFGKFPKVKEFKREEIDRFA